MSAIDTVNLTPPSPGMQCDGLACWLPGRSSDSLCSATTMARMAAKDSFHCSPTLDILTLQARYLTKSQQLLSLPIQRRERGDSGARDSRWQRRGSGDGQAQWLVGREAAVTELSQANMESHHKLLCSAASWESLLTSSSSLLPTGTGLVTCEDPGTVKSSPLIALPSIHFQAL